MQSASKTKATQNNFSQLKVSKKTYHQQKFVKYLLSLGKDNIGVSHTTDCISRRCKHYFGIPLPRDWKKMYEKPKKFESESDSSDSSENVSSRQHRK